MSPKRRSYCADYKLQVVKYAHENGKRAAGRKFGVSEKLVRDWRKMEVTLHGMEKTRKANRGQKAKWPELETRLYKWLIEQCGSGRDLTTVQVRLHARGLAKEMNINDFKGGSSWCYRFMHRNRLFASHNHGQEPKKKIPKTPRTEEKEEERIIKQEEEQLPVCVPESSVVCVKTEETQETEEDTEHYSPTYKDDDWTAPYNWSDDEDYYNRVKAAHNSDVQMPSQSPGPGLNLPQMKEEPEEWIIKQEEEQSPVCLLQFSDVCVKTEESSLLQQRQSEHREDTQREDTQREDTQAEDMNADTEGDTDHSSFTDDDENWTAPFSSSDEEHTDQGQAAHIGYRTETAEGAKEQKCPFCNKTFVRKAYFNRHILIHTGEKPFRCSVCNETFSLLSSLKVHRARAHANLTLLTL